MTLTPKKFSYIIELEGRKLSYDPRPTRLGIEQQEYDEYRRSKGQAVRSVALIEDNEAFEIYYRTYWNPMGCFRLPETLDFCLFQFGVNCGNSVAVSCLQRIMGVPDDGLLGDKTIEAIWNRIKIEGVNNISITLLTKQKDRYIERYKTHPDKHDELRGLINRCQFTANFYDLGVIA